jgi:serine/threonine-protein kinase RsbW
MSTEKETRPRVVRLIFPSDLGFLPVLNAVTEEALRLAGADGDAADAMANAVMEAGTNAAQYGPEGSEVDVEFFIGRGDLEVAVSDEGPGFDPERVSGPGGSSASMALRGRGLLIMKALADEVSFEERPGGGTTVRLVKRFEKGA